MLGWPQEAEFAFSSKNIQPLTSLDVLYSNSWSPSLSMLQPVSQARADPAWQLSTSCCSDKIPTLWDALQPCSWKSTHCCSTWPELLQNTPLCSQEGLLPCRGGTRQLTAFPQHQDLTAVSRELSWELKGYTQQLWAQVQTLSTSLPALQERRNHSLHPPLTSGLYSHLAAAQGSSAALSPAQGSLFQHHAPHVSLPCFPAEKPPSSRSNALMGKQI